MLMVYMVRSGTGVGCVVVFPDNGGDVSEYESMGYQVHSTYYLYPTEDYQDGTVIDVPSIESRG